MAIFGDLDHLPFFDLTRVLAHQTGTLFLRTAFAGRSVELHLDRAELRGLYLDGFPTNDPGRLRDTLHGLMTTATGTFEFQPTELTALSPHLKLTLSELLEPQGGAVLPEAQLPHPDTRFSPTDAPPAPPTTLAASWHQVRPQLEHGASAADIARQLHLSELQGRELLYRLRAAGLIVPVRATHMFQMAEQRPHLEFQAAVPMPEAVLAIGGGPVRRLLNALRRFTSAPGRA